KLRHGGQFVPPSIAGTVVFPGLDGGGEWGGTAFDPSSRLLYVNSDSMVSIVHLVDRPKAEGLVTGRALYRQHCVSCHGEDMAGAPPHFPALASVGRKLTMPEIAAVIRKGGGLMPAFAQLGGPAIDALAEYVAHGRLL